MDEASTLETVLDVCGHKHRRIVLATLANKPQSTSIDDLIDAVIKYNYHVPPKDVDEEVTRIHVDLQQVHLPKLAGAGFIQYDPERKVVEPTVEAGGENAHLSTILAMDSNLPTTYKSA